MKHLIIGGHDGVSFAMCGKDGTGENFADRQPEDGDCPGCLEVWRECDPNGTRFPGVEYQWVEVADAD